MKFLTDFHAHTVASGHAYSTIDEIAREAGKKGLEVIAITDHTKGMPAGAHEFHFNNLEVVPRELYGVTILRGAEANIINYDGEIDLDESVTRGLDLVIASYHPPCIPMNATVQEVTKGYLQAMENSAIKIIGHPGDSRYPFDHEAVVKASQKTGTILEVNNASLRPASFRPGVRENLIELLKYCNQYDVPIIANTDAHIAYQIGEFAESIQLLEEIKFPKSLIWNLQPQQLLEKIGYTSK